MKIPLVSIIIPTYNSSKTLDSCLKSVKNQICKNIEVIVVDRFSTDSTKRIAQKNDAIFLLKGPERTAQKNHGAMHAKGDFFYFVDSDFILNPDVVSKCVLTCNSGSDAVVVENYSVGKGLWAKSISLKRNLTKSPLTVASRFMTRKAFLEVGGFNENLIIGEDLDLHQRLIDMEYKINKINAIEWHVGEPETLEEIGRRGYYYGIAFASYLKRRGKLAAVQMNPYRLETVRKLLKKPSIYLISLVIVDMVRYIAALIGLIVYGFNHIINQYQKR